MPLTNEDVFFTGTTQGFAEGVETMIKGMDAGIEEADRTIADPEVGAMERRICEIVRERFVTIVTGLREGLAVAEADLAKALAEFSEEDRAVLDGLRASSKAQDA